LKESMVTIIVAQSSKMSMKPRRGLFNPKKNTDQRKLSRSCIEKKNSAILILVRAAFREVQTRNREIPIVIYSNVQTGAKSHAGGLNEGFASVRYQPPTEDDVKTEPIAPADRQMTIDAASFRYLILLMRIQFLHSLPATIQR